MEMKLRSVDPFADRKDIIYFGIKFSVIRIHKYMATDKKGWVCTFREKPNSTRDEWVCGPNVYYYRDYAGIVDLNGIDWKNTLKMIKECEIK